MARTWNWSSDQGIDERKPLFSLFLTRGGEWIGWNPQGPYDRSAEDAEQWIGWHQNTGKPANPVTFASAEKYRKEYLKPGLLDKLMSRGDLGAALIDLNKKNVPDPVVRLELRENGKLPARRDPNGLPVVQNRPLELIVNIDNVAENQLTWVRWRLDNGAWSDFARQVGNEFRHDVSGETWKRGPHTIEVNMRTTDGAGQPKSLQIAYIPAAPELSFPAQWLKQFGDGRQTNVRKKEFDIASTIEPLKGETAKATLLLNGKPVKEVDDGKIAETLTLIEGRNELIVRAVNSGAGKGDAAQETRERVFIVDFSPVAVPRVVIESVTPASDGGTQPREKIPVVVHQSKVRIRGILEAETELTDAELDGKALPEFKSAAVKKWPFDIEHKLQPGEQTLVFKAKAKDAPERTWKLTIEFIPELPVFVLRKPADLDALPSDTKKITLEGVLAPLEKYPFEFTLFAGEKQEKITVDQTNQSFRVDVLLEAGSNTLELRAKLNDRSRVMRVRAYVLRPPSILQFNAAAPAKSLVDLTAEVETPADVDLSGVRLTGPGAERQLDLVKDVRKGDEVKGKRKWTITIAEVPLVEEVDNDFVLRVTNRDGEVQQGVTVKGPKRVAKTAVVTLMDPKRDVTVETETYSVQFSVNSDTDLTRLVVLRDGEELPPLPHRDRITEQTVKVPLKAGPNVIEVVAVNAGGEARSEKRTISRRADTVFLNVEKIGLRSGTGKEVAPVRKNDKIVFEETEGGELVLQGRVRWLDKRDHELKQPQLVRIWVNDFEQFPAALDTANEKLERSFRIAIRLNQEKNNRITIALPGLKIDQTTPAEFMVEKCLKPEKQQRLHLLIVGVGLKDADQSKLVGKVLDVFQARKVVEGNARNLVVKEFETPVFKEGRVYGPMAGDATKQEVYAMLEHISDTVRNEQGQMNEVLVVYFEGQRELKNNDYFLLTQQALLLKNNDRAALTRDGLRGAIAKTLGAQLLLMDLTQPNTKEGKTIAPTDSHLTGMIEYAWLRNNPPDNGRLLESLKSSIAQARMLNEVSDQVSQRGTQLRKDDKDFQFDVRVSKILGQMAVGSGN